MPSFVEAQRLRMGATAHRDEHFVEVESRPIRRPLMRRDQALLRAGLETFRLVCREHVDAFAAQNVCNQFGDIGVLLRQHSIGHVDQRHLAAEPLKTSARVRNRSDPRPSREAVAAMPAASRHRPTSTRRRRAMPGIGGMNGSCTLAITMLRAVIRRPSTSTVYGSTILRAAGDTVDAERRVPLNGIVRRDRCDRIAHTLHHRAEIDFPRDVAQPISLRVLSGSARSWRSG